MLNGIPHASDWVNHVVFPTNRWLHIVCTSMMVGGTFFYEFVIPRAIDDLKPEAQLSVLGRTRWVFRQIVLFCSLAMIVTGVVSIWRHLPMYQNNPAPGANYLPARPWLIAHLAVGILSLAVALVTVRRVRPPRQPMVWLRANFVVLLIAIFLAAVTRYVRLTILYHHVEDLASRAFVMPHY